LSATDELRPPAGAQWPEIRAWRKHRRQALLADRVAMDAQARAARALKAKERLRSCVDLSRHGLLGLYWPIRGEIDLRDVAREHIDRGGSVALPVVVERGGPVEFWHWAPGIRMTRGLWDIPVPAERVLVHPDALLVPLVGFDPEGYRLGYGGGYYDRTLAAAVPRPYCIGIGFATGALESIGPQPHDIPMNVIVTDDALLEYA
jgi:5-formyltetrahydrofolate cyclo-ligase